MKNSLTHLHLFAVIGLAVFSGVAGCSSDRGDQMAEKAEPAEPVISTPNETHDVTETGQPEEMVGESEFPPESAVAKPAIVLPQLKKPQLKKRQRAPAAKFAADPALEPPQATANQPAEVLPNSADRPPAFLERLPAGATRRQADGFSTIKVFYGTDRKSQTISATPSATSTPTATYAALLLMIGAIVLLIARKIKIAVVAAALAGVICLGLFLLPIHSIKKNGMTYSGERGHLVHGIANVTVPDKHQPGMLERPSLLRFEISEDQKKHIVLTSAVELDPAQFYDELAETVTQSSDHDLLVFIHGYNVDFESALQRTAQLAVDLPFRGAAVCYSWPSQGSIVSYTVDENNVTWTIPHLRDFLLDLTERSGATSINVVAHSMGNRAMASAMSQINLQVENQREPLFDRIVLAAPDIDADHFRSELGPRLARVGRNITLYASSDDQALLVSKHLHGGYPRAGESGDQLVVIPEVETIDVSGVDLSLLGHSYYGGSEPILRDLYEVVRKRLPASERASLIARPFKEATYWLLQPPQVSELPDPSLR